MARRFPPFSTTPVSFRERSRFETAHTPGLAPALLRPVTVEIGSDGKPRIGGITLPKVSEAQAAGNAGALAQQPNQYAGRTIEELTRLILQRLQETGSVIRGELIPTPFTATLNPQLIRPAERRSYFFLQNQSAANQIVLGFGSQPGPAGATPVAGLIIAPNFGFYEMLVFVTQQPIWVVASAAPTPGIMLHGA